MTNEPPFRHPNRVRIALELWDRAITSPKLGQFDKWLSQTLKQYKQFGKKDRAFYSDLLFLMMRHALFASFVENYKKDGKFLSRYLSQYTTVDLLYSLIQSTPSRSIYKWAMARVALDEFQNGSAASTPTTTNETDFLLSLMEKLEESLFLESQLLFHSVPPFYAPHFRRRMDSHQLDCKKWLIAQDSRPPVWIRLNHQDKKESVISELKENGFFVDSHSGIICINGSSSLQKLIGFQNGFFEIQDFASQMIGNALPLTTKAAIVWDACAGGGGKTMQIAGRLANNGAVYASDIREFKLDEVKQRARRAGFYNVRTFAWDGSPLTYKFKEVEKRGGFDVVLVDAPCSSSGTWRRNPDAKYRFDFDGLVQLTNTQLTILTNAAHATRIGGFVVYATCSWLTAENEDVVHQFLNQNSNFSLQSTKLTGLPEGVDADTMFVAVLQRNS